METHRIQISGATRAADLVDVTPSLPLPAHAPVAHDLDGHVELIEPADERVWTELERMLAAREAARAMHPAGRGRTVPGRAA